MTLKIIFILLFAYTNANLPKQAIYGLQNGRNGGFFGDNELALTFFGERVTRGTMALIAINQKEAVRDEVLKQNILQPFFDNYFDLNDKDFELKVEELKQRAEDTLFKEGRATRTIKNKQVVINFFQNVLLKGEDKILRLIEQETDEDHKILSMFMELSEAFNSGYFQLAMERFEDLINYHNQLWRDNKKSLTESKKLKLKICLLHVLKSYFRYLVCLLIAQDNGDGTFLLRGQDGVEITFEISTSFSFFIITSKAKPNTYDNSENMYQGNKKENSSDPKVTEYCYKIIQDLNCIKPHLDTDKQDRNINPLILHLEKINELTSKDIQQFDKDDTIAFNNAKKAIKVLPKRLKEKLRDKRSVQQNLEQIEKNAKALIERLEALVEKTKLTGTKIVSKT